MHSSRKPAFACGSRAPTDARFDRQPGRHADQRAGLGAVAGFRRPESVLILVYIDRARVLVLRRVTPFDFWQSVTGSLLVGESPLEAARRELFEETGLRHEGTLSDRVATREFVIDPRWRDRFEPGVTVNTEHEFRYRLNELVDIRMDANEHSAHQWLDIDAAIAKVWSWTNKTAFELLREEL